MPDTEQLLADLGYSKAHLVENRASIADLFRRGRRCGIYVLHFATGEYYAGQAVDVTRRYVQHRKTHEDIIRISFREVDQGSLDYEERRVISALESNAVLLRNIALTSFPHGPSDLDQIIPAAVQDAWHQGAAGSALQHRRFDDPDLRRKYGRRYQRFLQLPHATAVIRVLRQYAGIGILEPRLTEQSFWACSCLPGSTDYLYSRVNIGQQEVLTAIEICGILEFSFHMARSPLEEAYGHSPLAPWSRRCVLPKFWPRFSRKDGRAE